MSRSGYTPTIPTGCLCVHARVILACVGTFTGVFLCVDGGSALARGRSAPIVVRAKRMATPKAAKTRGRRYSAGREGWSVRLPRGWRVRSAKGKPLTLDVRRRGAGRIFVRFRPGVTRRDMLTLKRQSVLRYNIRFKSGIGHLRGWSTRRHRAIESNMVAVGRRARYQPALRIAVLGPRGALSIIGYARKTRIAALRKRLRGMAKTVRFYTPKRSGAVK